MSRRALRAGDPARSTLAQLRAGPRAGLVSRDEAETLARARRFLWNLQFGQTRMVPKARAAGAPFNGVCISAGIPDVDEATELFAQLHQDGFP